MKKASILSLFKIKKFEKNSKERVIKNLLALNIGFLLIFAAANGIASVQSVLNKDGNLGVYSQLIMFCVQIPLSISFPTLIIESLGFKYTMVIAEVGYATFVATNMYPRYYTIIPTSIIIGVCQSLVWTLLGIYLAILSEQYAGLTGKTFQQVQTIFISIFSCLFLSSYVVSSILISTILKTGSSKANSTFDYIAHCGSSNCPSSPLPTSTSKPSLGSVYGLCAALLALCFIAVLITLLFMDNRPEKTNQVQVAKKEKPKKNILYLVRRLKTESSDLLSIPKKLDLLLLLPITAYTGFEVTILWNEFNKSFVTCVFNLNYIGYTNLVFGAAGAILSPLFGYITRYTSQVAFIVFMLMISMANAVFMLTWIPNPASVHVIFFMAIAFGISQSYANGQVRGLFLIHITDNKNVFSLATLFQTLGFFAGFLFSLFACTRVKVYFYFALISFSLLCYILLIARENRYKVEEIVQMEQELEEKKSLELIDKAVNTDNGSINEEKLNES